MLCIVAITQKNSPSTAARRRTTELATLKRKIQRKFFEKKVYPGRPVDQFIAELDLLLQRLHDVPISLRPRQSLNISNEHRFNLEFPPERVMSPRPLLMKKNKNYRRLVKRLKHKLRSHNVLLQKTDKSKVFQLGKIDDYQKKSDEYMEKTKAYQCLGHDDPLPSLIQRTNKYLLEMRLAKWITQKQYESLCVDQDEAELAHLYYLPKSHKPNTPLRPIISSLKYPTTKISKFLDDQLRPLFNSMAKYTNIESGFDLIKQLNPWSVKNMTNETLFCTMDVVDLYTMIPQIESVLSLKEMLDYLQLKHINSLRTEAIIRLSRFVMKNNYFTYNGQFYHQIRGGAMGSPLTLTIANCYMFFYEQKIIRQVKNSGGLYFRYIDDIFLSINWPKRHLLKQIEQWNTFDENIKINAHVDQFCNFLDLDIKNDNGKLITQVYHKPSYEPYYLPFHSIHPIHMKKNVPFTLLVRAIRYCSTFQLFVNERESSRMALLLNKYPNNVINTQFQNVLERFQIGNQLNEQNYSELRTKILESPDEQKSPMDYENNIFVHFTYCSNMRNFPHQFHTLWKKYFQISPIDDITPILGIRNADNLQRQLVRNKRNNPQNRVTSVQE